MELKEEVVETKRGGLLQSTSKRVRMIFSVMASPNRIDILRILNSQGPLTYSELKALAGFKSKKESGKFAYHLRKLLRQSLVALNKSERRYTITNLGKLVLSLARQIEERSIIESGKMYVRTSHESIEEFNSYKITQSLVREGSLPLELAQKITEEVENRIYKYQTTYLTGSLIREMVNSVLLEHGHEEYRSKLARLGMPVHNVQEMLTNIDSTDSGIEGLLYKAGQTVFSEYLLANILPKDVADAHLSGDIHITNPGLWQLLPDIIFVNIREILEDGLDLDGKFLHVPRIKPIKDSEDLALSLSMVISLISKEASKEVVLDGLPQVVTKYAKGVPDFAEKLASIFATASTTSKFARSPTRLSLRLPLGSDAKAVTTIISAYKIYAKNTPSPHIGLVIDYEKGKVKDISGDLSEIITMGGKVMISSDQRTSDGITNKSKPADTVAIDLDSVSINLPRLAFESNKDETYFRARLALLLKPALASMSLRKNDVFDLTRRGINPVLARHTQYMQRGSSSLVINLVGLNEAVFNILGCEKEAGRAIYHKVIETAIDVAKKKGKEMGETARVAMIESAGSERFATLDGEKYGKNSVLSDMQPDSYSEGVIMSMPEVQNMTPKSEAIAECNKVSNALSGGLLVRLTIPKDAAKADISKALEKMATLVPSFRPEIEATSEAKP